MEKLCEFTLGTQPPSGVFQQAVSLGGGCMPAWHLQRKFGRLVRSPFDWMITPYFSMMHVLEDDGNHLGQSFFIHKEGVGCAHYGLIYYHEFPRLKGGSYMLNDNTIAICRSKLMHKMSRMTEACRGKYRTLFIRMGEYGDADDGNPVGPATESPARKVTVSALNDMANLLSRKFPDLDFHVIYIDYEGVGRLTPENADVAPVNRLSIVHMPRLSAMFDKNYHPSPGEKTLGNSMQWNDFFSAFNLTADSPYLRADIDRRY